MPTISGLSPQSSRPSGRLKESQVKQALKGGGGGSILQADRPGAAGHRAVVCTQQGPTVLAPCNKDDHGELSKTPREAGRKELTRGTKTSFGLRKRKEPN